MIAGRFVQCILNFIGDNRGIGILKYTINKAILYYFIFVSILKLKLNHCKLLFHKGNKKICNCKT